MPAPRVGFNKKITGGVDENPFKAPMAAAPVPAAPPSTATKANLVKPPKNKTNKFDEPTLRGNAAGIEPGMKAQRPASFTEALTGLFDSLTGTATKNTPRVMIGPGARPYIKDFQPGKGVQAVLLRPKKGGKLGK